MDPKEDKTEASADEAEEEVEKEETPEPVKVPNPLTGELSFIISALESAQSKTGAFTLTDCKNIKESKDKLFKVFDEDPKYVDKDIPEAYAVLLRASEMQQAKGIFNMDGSVQLLEKLVKIEAYINERKNASMKLESLLKEKETERKKKKKKSKGKD